MQINPKINTILLLVIIVMLGFGLWKLYTPKDILPAPPVKDRIISPIESLKKDIKMILKQKPQTVIEGQEFTIKLGEKVFIADSYGATFTLKEFSMECPEGKQCFDYFEDVFYEIQVPTVKNNDGSIQQQEKLYIKDKSGQDVSKFPFVVTVISSDYKTYAKIVIQGQYQVN